MEQAEVAAVDDTVGRVARGQAAYQREMPRSPIDGKDRSDPIVNSDNMAKPLCGEYPDSHRG